MQYIGHLENLTNKQNICEYSQIFTAIRSYLSLSAIFVLFAKNGYYSCAFVNIRLSFGASEAPRYGQYSNLRQVGGLR